MIRDLNPPKSPGHMGPTSPAVLSYLEWVVESCGPSQLVGSSNCALKTKDFAPGEYSYIYGTAGDLLARAQAGETISIPGIS